MLGSCHQCSPETSWIIFALLYCFSSRHWVLMSLGTTIDSEHEASSFLKKSSSTLFLISGSVANSHNNVCWLILLLSSQLVHHTIPGQTSIYTSCALTDKRVSCCPRLTLLKSLFPTIAALSHVSYHIISLISIQSQLSYWTQPLNLSFLFHMLHVVVHRHFREASSYVHVKHDIVPSATK